jgi:hypothetical protein
MVIRTKPKPIYTRFEPDEDLEIRKLAKENDWTLSDVVRELARIGLEHFKEGDRKP